MRSLLLLIAIWLLTSPAFAIDRPDPPEVRVARTEEGRIRVELVGGARASGYNIYRDDAYRGTVRPPSGASSFTIDGEAGEYCIVAFVESAEGTRYSVCSASVRIDAPAEGDGPGAPSGLRSVVYSPGVAELFWTRSPDHASLAGYELLRDGVRVAFHKGASHFEPRLARDRAHRYTLVAVAPDGRRSASLQHTIERTDGRPPVDPPPPEGELDLELSAARVTLVEGASGGASVVLTASRAPGTSRALTLELLADSSVDARGLEHRFAPATLEGEARQATLHLALPIGMAPRQPHERRFRVRVSDGRTSVERALALDVVPVDAPDVYLLLGQSNMEGLSERGAKLTGAGQPDAPHPRIRQLHVSHNDRTALPDGAAFVDEGSNVLSPRFILAEDPLHERLWPNSGGKAGTSIGPSLSFAKAALARTARDIYLVPAAWGGTGFCANSMDDIAWNAEPRTAPGLGGTWLLERALLRLDVTLRETGGILRGILWHQGGADSNDPRCAERYADNLVRMVRRLRREARVDARGPSARGEGAAIPFVLATMSRGRDERGDYSVFSATRRQVDVAHRRIGEFLPHADFINLDDLVPPAYPCGRNSCVHYGSEAQREQGLRFDAAFRRIAERG